MWAQSRLMAYGYYEGDLDGRYDREVTLAVRKYQAENGLTITGIIDRKTWTSLAVNDDHTEPEPQEDRNSTKSSIRLEKTGSKEA
jgi:peptidoglycan hydrolase-like protein with peptidoglycan-binding domain